MIRYTTAVACLAAFCAVACLEARATGQGEGQPKVIQQDTEDQASAVFAKIIPTLQRKSGVPPRLPTYLPGIHRSSEMYAILGSANSKGYGILLGFDPDCEGQNVCLYGSVQGSVFRIKLDRGPGVQVRLRGGIRGRFVDSECFAYCNQSFITWNEGGFYYAIGRKAGKKDDLIRAANSAIPQVKRP